MGILYYITLSCIYKKHLYLSLWGTLLRNSLIVLQCQSKAWVFLTDLQSLMCFLVYEDDGLYFCRTFLLLLTVFIFGFNVDY